MSGEWKMIAKKTNGYKAERNMDHAVRVGSRNRGLHKKTLN